MKKNTIRNSILFLCTNVLVCSSCGTTSNMDGDYYVDQAWQQKFGKTVFPTSANTPMVSIKGSEISFVGVKGILRAKESKVTAAFSRSDPNAESILKNLRFVNVSDLELSFSMTFSGDSISLLFPDNTVFIVLSRARGKGSVPRS